MSLSSPVGIVQENVWCIDTGKNDVTWSYQELSVYIRSLSPEPQAVPMPWRDPRIIQKDH